MKFEDYDDKERIKLLEDCVRLFAGYFSSDDSEHWRLHAIADNEDFEVKDWVK